MEDKKIKMDIYPRFLDNKPCGQDLFEGKSHETIAKNIATILKNGAAKIIGLDGGWGSGKSNMVDIIMKDLDHNACHFFIYDAWGHQEDLQRRSILEELTQFLTQNDNGHKAILNNVKWTNKLKGLLAKKREIETKTIPKISCGIILTALAIVTTPILDTLTSNMKSDIGKIIIKSIPLCLVILLIVGLFVKNLISFRKDKGVFWCIKNSLSEAFNIYTDKQKEDTTFETISEEEPSARKFRNWIHEIDEDIHGHLLIIVFDNMDRLPSPKVQDLWAAIHTFFSDEKYNNIRVIVPFDRAHIKNAFKNEDSQSDSDCFGNDYINKTFDVIYRVSPPIMNDWKDYFANRWKEAFGMDLEQNSRITQIYDLLSKSPTPREINAFINEFVSIKQITTSSIPDEYIALFIFGKDKISSDTNEILHPTYLGAIDFLYKDDTELPKNISALYYQLPPERALETIYTENLKKALDNCDVDQIKSIQGLPNLFFKLLENAITKVTNYSNSVLALDQCFNNEYPQTELMIWDCIYKNAKQHISENTLQDYHKVLLNKITQKEELLNLLIDLFLNHKDFNVIVYYKSVKQLSEIDSIAPFNYLQEKEVGPSEFIEFVEASKDNYIRYKIICKPEELDKYLSGLDIKHLKNLSAIPYIKNDYDISSYQNYVCTLVDNNLNNRENIKVLYERLKELECPIAKKLPDNYIQTHFSATNNSDEFYYDLICMRIAHLNNFSQNFRAPFNNILNTKDDAVVEKVAERIEFYMNYDTILLNLQNMNNPLYVEVAKKLTVHSYRKSKMNILEVLQNYIPIKNALGLDNEILIRRFNDLASEEKKQITLNNVNIIPIDFFKDIVGQKNELAVHVIKTAKDYLSSKSKDEWKQFILTSDSYEYSLLMIIKPKIQNCFDAFKELLVEKIQTNNRAFSKDKCTSLIELSESNGRELLTAFNNVRDCFCSGAYTMSNDIFSFYGEWLLKYAKLEEQASALRTIFTTSVLDKKENVQLILTYQEKMIRIVEKAGEENKDFKDKIKSLLDGEYKNDKSFEDFAKSIGVEKNSMIENITDDISTK